MENQTQNRREESGPIVEGKYSKSKDGKWIIHRTTIVDIKPVAYLKEVIKSERE